MERIIKPEVTEILKTKGIDLEVILGPHNNKAPGKSSFIHIVRGLVHTAMPIVNPNESLQTSEYLKKYVWLINNFPEFREGQFKDDTTVFPGGAITKYINEKGKEYLGWTIDGENRERPYYEFEGELSRSLDFLGVAALGIQDTSGLAIDAMNTWCATRMLFIGYGEKEDLEKKMQRPICTYRENYVQCKREEAHIEQIMSVVEPEALHAFDDQVRKYNSLPLEEKLTGVVEEYAARCDTIILEGVK